MRKLLVLLLYTLLIQNELHAQSQFEDDLSWLDGVWTSEGLINEAGKISNEVYIFRFDSKKMMLSLDYNDTHRIIEQKNYTYLTNKDTKMLSVFINAYPLARRQLCIVPFKHKEYNYLHIFVYSLSNEAKEPILFTGTFKKNDKN